MKIEKLKPNSLGRYDLEELPDKINEIIDLLNNSFITNDPDTVYGEVTDSLTTITCDRLTPLSNETTADLQFKNIEDAVKGTSIYDGIKCPNCGSTCFTIGSSYCTAVYYPPIIKDGVNINPDRNKCTTNYTCCECGHDWSE